MPTLNMRAIIPLSVALCLGSMYFQKGISLKCEGNDKLKVAFSFSQDYLIGKRPEGVWLPLEVSKILGKGSEPAY